MDKDTVIEIRNLKKKYKLGIIGGGTLRGAIRSKIALCRGKEDPNAMIGVSGDYGKEFWALNGVDLTVKRGERLGIIGHNGAGKSTMLKLLSRITAPTEGEIRIRGRITSMLEVGTGFHGELTGRENIYLNAAILGMTKEEVDAKLNDIIEFSECEEFIDTPVKRYSSGMYVKLAFAVAAHLDSEIMIMDEVLAVGDVNFQEKCLRKMREIASQENRTILYVSHNMNTIKKLCDRCIVMCKGNIIFDGNTDEAIQIYLGQETSKEGESYYLGAKRKKEVARIINISFETCKTQEKILISGDMVEKLVVKIRVFENVIDAHIRLLVRYMDTSCAGTYFSETMSFEAGNDYEVSFDLPIDMLPDGFFYLQAVLSKTVDNGENIKYSQIDCAAQFEIKREYNTYADLSWNNGWRVNLGLIKVNDIKTLN